MATLREAWCYVWGHWPALVTQPCRCRRCGHMIVWQGAGWRLMEPADERQRREVRELKAALAHYRAASSLPVVGRNP